MQKNNRDVKVGQRIKAVRKSKHDGSSHHEEFEGVVTNVVPYLSYHIYYISGYSSKAIYSDVYDIDVYDIEVVKPPYGLVKFTSSDGAERAGIFYNDFVADIDQVRFVDSGGQGRWSYANDVTNLRPYNE